eukprot:jgi/Chrzof1/8992/Cz03g32050.t1
MGKQRRNKEPVDGPALDVSPLDSADGTNPAAAEPLWLQWPPPLPQSVPLNGSTKPHYTVIEAWGKVVVGPDAAQYLWEGYIPITQGRRGHSRLFGKKMLWGIDRGDNGKHYVCFGTLPASAVDMQAQMLHASRIASRFADSVAGITSLMYAHDHAPGPEFWMHPELPEEGKRAVVFLI